MSNTKKQIEDALEHIESLNFCLRTANSMAADQEPLASIILLDLIEQAVKIENKLAQIQKVIQ